MSRIGKQPINIPSKVSVTIKGSDIEVKGPSGTLSHSIHSTMTIVKEDANLLVKPKDSSDPAKNFHGLTRTLVANMIAGVSKPFEKSLKLVGVGYRAQSKGRDLHLTLGYSHPIVYKVPEGIDVKVDKQTLINVTGTNKALVGQVSADIRAFRKPEPYHGKGVRYADEVIITKAGKTGAKK
jgi:large subunit ribosomal protein L6